MPSNSLGELYDRVNGEEETRLCKDIPEAACKHLPRNYFAYLASNVISKLADELSSARLVLPWLFSSLGAPIGLVGFIVPLREAGVLIPQLFVSEYLRRKEKRKEAWLAGAAFSGLCLLLIGSITPFLGSTLAGYVTLFLLLAYSLGRGICSVSAKDVIGKTVSKKRRGTLMGYSAGLSSALVLFVGLWLTFALEDGGDSLPFILLLAAGLLWFLSVYCFSRIVEEPGATEGARSPIAAIRENIGLLTDDPDFRRYLIVRALLLSVALAPPFYALMAKEGNDTASTLGWLIVAGGIAGSIGGPIWGRFADLSSRMTMSLASLACGIFGIGIAVVQHFGDSRWLESSIAQGFLFFVVSVFYAGVRLGRKAYLVDMVSGDKSGYVAVGNTLIGIALLVMGSLGFLAQFLGPSGTIGVLGLISVGASLAAWRLREVSG
ncbi:MFS transporter [Pelagicoccus sp. NFK12]|uniref:MFS transporter n=1 Tax=Pelagicoccus enzymogenes TaxID=2773457 RepID=A0A927F9S2_9BACT|nr:MFS transporter [Pelagicoccus enzymogenes]MBD5781112.1 MFS transporter [Pelagicoccus enzymogenes]MDQ8199818.1 MFS transporter [Pelagicoccus enzymogenes]